MRLKSLVRRILRLVFKVYNIILTPYSCQGNAAIGTATQRASFAQGVDIHREVAQHNIHSESLHLGFEILGRE